MLNELLKYFPRDVAFVIGIIAFGEYSMFPNMYYDAGCIDVIKQLTTKENATHLVYLACEKNLQDFFYFALNKCDYKGHIEAYHVACYYGNVAFAEIAYNTIDVSYENQLIGLNYSCESGCIPLVKFHITLGLMPSATNLEEVALAGKLPMVRYLHEEFKLPITKKVFINACSHEDEELFNYCICKIDVNYATLEEAFIKGQSPKIASLLLVYGLEKFYECYLIAMHKKDKQLLDTVLMYADRYNLEKMWVHNYTKSMVLGRALKIRRIIQEFL